MDTFEHKLMLILKGNVYRDDDALELMGKVDTDLSDETKSRITCGNLINEIYYDIFIESLCESKENPSAFDAAVNKKLNDQDYIIEKIALYQHR